MRLLLSFCFAVMLAPTVRAKLGENPAQITKRFGSNYTIEHAQGGDVFKYHLKTFSADVTFTNGVSTCETYYSDHPLDADGTPPRAIVQGVLHTNVPGAKWRVIVASYFHADYAVRSGDYKYIATMNYTTPQPPGGIWTITVQVARYVTPPQTGAVPVAAIETPARSQAAKDTAEVFIQNVDPQKVRAFMVESLRRQSGMITDVGSNFFTYSDQVMSPDGRKVRWFETFSLFGEGDGVRVKVRAKAVFQSPAGLLVEQPVTGDIMEKTEAILLDIKNTFETSTLAR